MTTRFSLLKSTSLGLMAALLTLPAMADDTKIGILFDVTGPIASFIPPMMDSVTATARDEGARRPGNEGIVAVRVDGNADGERHDGFS